MLSLSITEDDPLRLASRLRAERATQEIPLLLIAEPEQHRRLLRGFDLGANDWVVRPVDENELRVRAAATRSAASSTRTGCAPTSARRWNWR